MSRYGWFLGTQAADYDRAKNVLDQAISIARRENDIRLEMRSLAITSRVETLTLHPIEAARNGSKAVELANSANELQTELSARMWISDGLAAVGDMEGVRDHIEAARSLADRLRDRNGFRMTLGRSATGRASDFGTPAFSASCSGFSSYAF